MTELDALDLEARVSTIDSDELRAYKKRLDIQRWALDDARREIERAEKLAAYWLDEVNKTKIKMRRYEEMGLE